MIKFAVYVGFGAAMHYVFVGEKFMPDAATTYAWLFAWPIMLFVLGLKWFLIAALIVAVIAFILFIPAIVREKMANRRAILRAKDIRNRRL